ncbi:MAG: hypothetical protein ACRD5J_10400 [Nitrososphaeraceae archaeon]
MIRSSRGGDSQSSALPEEKPQYRNPIPPGYMPSSPPPSRITSPSRPISSQTSTSSTSSIVAFVIIVAIIILIIALILNPYLLILIPVIVIGAVRGLKKGTGVNQYYDNTSRRSHRSK